MPRALFVIVAALAFLAPQTASAQAQGGPPVVAAINLSLVFTNSPQANKLQAQLQTLQAEITSDLQSRQQEIQKMQSQLEEIAPRTPEYAAKQEEILLAGLNFQAYQEFQQARARREQLSGFLKLYQSVQAAIESVSRREGIDLVLQYRPPTIPKVENYEQMQAAISSRFLLHASDTVLITELVIQELTLMDKQ